MLKVERKLLEFVEKYIVLFSALLLSLLALYLRKVGIWWRYENIGAYFDMHENYTYTAAYFLLIRLIQYLPFLPLYSIKWLAGISDFGVAGLVVYLLGKETDGRKKLIFYVVSVFSPVLFLRGVIWAQLDSFAMILLLAGYALQSSNRKKGRAYECIAFIFVIGGISLCPYLFPIVLFYLWQNNERQQNFWIQTAFLAAGGLLVQLVSAFLMSEAWTDGLYSTVRFLTYHPESGMRYEDATEWLLQMIYLYSPVASVLTALAAARRRLSYNWTIGIQIVATVLYGSVLFTELP